MCPWFCGIVLVIVFVLARRYGLWYFKLVHCYSNEVWKMWWKGGHSWRFEERCEMEWTPHVVKMSNDISRNLSWFILCQSRCLFLCFDYVFCDGCQVSAVSSAAATDNIDFTILIWPLPAPNTSHDLPILHRVPTVKLSAFIKFLMTFLGSIAYSEHNRPTYIKHVLAKDRF